MNSTLAAIALASKIVIALMAIFVLVWACFKFPKRPRQTLYLLGLRPRAAPKLLAQGVLCSGVAMLGILVASLVTGVTEITDWRPFSIQAVRLTALIAIVAVLEEVGFRVLSFNGIRLAARSSRLALLGSALLFGLYHAGNPGATSFSIVGNAAGGFMYAAAFYWSGSVWFPIGLHFGWNFFQGPVFGFPVSGLSLGGLLVQRADPDASFLNGGGYGPEAGLFGLLFRILLILLIWRIFRDTPRLPGPSDLDIPVPDSSANS